MTARTVAGRRQEEAAARDRLRGCFEERVTHIRCGDWRGPRGSRVTFVGTVSELHGTVCTDCPSSPNYQGGAA